MVNVSTCTLIHAPRRDVAAFAADPDNAPAWYANIHRATWHTPKPLAVGSRVAFTARFLGRNLDYVYEVVQFDPDGTLVMQSSNGPFPMRTTYSWSEENGSTRMWLQNTGAPTGFSALGGVFMAPLMRRAMRKDLAALKRILEKSLPST